MVGHAVVTRIGGIAHSRHHRICSIGQLLTWGLEVPVWPDLEAFSPRGAKVGRRGAAYEFALNLCFSLRTFVRLHNPFRLKNFRF